MKMEMPKDLRSGIEELLEKKKVTEEKDKNPQIPAVQEFICSELKRQKNLLANMADDRKNEWDILNEIFMEMLN